MIPYHNKHINKRAYLVFYPNVYYISYVVHAGNPSAFILSKSDMSNIHHYNTFETSPV